MPTSNTSRPDPAKLRSSMILGAIVILIIFGLGAMCLVLTGCSSEPVVQESLASSTASTTTTSAIPEYTADEQAFLDNLREQDGIQYYEGQADDLVDTYHKLCDDVSGTYDIWDVMNDNLWLTSDDAVSVVTTAFFTCPNNK